MQNDLINRLLNNERRAVARSISIVESSNSASTELLKNIFPNIGNAYRIGITGPPGSGKSTITNQLTKYYRKQNKKVGIIAVDPTSPFSGGALLGDRVRMMELAMDDGVFIILVGGVDLFADNKKSLKKNALLDGWVFVFHGL